MLPAKPSPSPTSLNAKETGSHLKTPEAARPIQTRPLCCKCNSMNNLSSSNNFQNRCKTNSSSSNCSTYKPCRHNCSKSTMPWITSQGSIAYRVRQPTKTTGRLCYRGQNTIEITPRKVPKRASNKKRQSVTSQRALWPPLTT